VVKLWERILIYWPHYVLFVPSCLVGINSFIIRFRSGADHINVFIQYKKSLHFYFNLHYFSRLVNHNLKTIMMWDVFRCNSTNIQQTLCSVQPTIKVYIKYWVPYKNAFIGAAWLKQRAHVSALWDCVVFWKD